MTVDELLVRCTSSELSEWRALYKIEAAEAKAAHSSGQGVSNFAAARGE